MNEELNKTIKEFYIKQQKLLDEMTNYSKTQLISIIEIYDYLKELKEE